MNLNAVLSEKGYIFPAFDIEKVKAASVKEPEWLHFGAGNLFRAFPAVLQQGLIERGLSGKGITVCEEFDGEIIEKAYTPFGNQHLSVTLGADGSCVKRVVASVAEAFTASGNYQRLAEICASPALKIISLTVTEKGYQSRNLIELIAKLCRERYSAGGEPIALLSLDNCSKNGDVLKAAIAAIAEEWKDGGFCDYLNDSRRVSFPLSMIDKITPRPSEEVAAMLERDGFPHREIFKTAKNTHIAAFVNAESAQYLAIEDKFPNGRPPLEREGVIFCDRETVDRIEAMKVRTALNPLHTAMSIFARLFGYGYVYEAMRDGGIKGFITKLGHDELMPMAVNPGVIDPSAFMDEVINERFPNPYIPDMPQRILCDTSQKMPVRFGETLKAYAEKSPERLSDLTLIPLVIAGWLRYLKGEDDAGNPIELSPDPLLGELKGLSADEILAREDIFGINILACPLAEKVKGMLGEMSAGKGAVRAVFERTATGAFTVKTAFSF
ncbi:MAG: mannitol dehydrogenase family protein [Oscillospiraceae bacterium]|jgi:fructuronate reductase|nr:mannitol dehydrogenase family protein [Oscillospiraceae bacterium]